MSIWESDLLGRKDVAQYLTKYLDNRYRAKGAGEQGFVLAVNAEWGFGKTYLLKNWAAELQSLNYAAVYFDAWKNDFTPEPLVAFISRMDKELRVPFKEIPEAKRLLAEVVKKAALLWKPAGIALVKILLKRGANISIDELAEMLNQDDDENEGSDVSVDAGSKKEKAEIVEALSKAVKSTLSEHESKETAITSFREKLSLLIEELAKTSKFQLPIFFFVDELDRCRPDYAIELLEGIKHLFGVPGIYFVIGTNLSQLGESIKAVYGSGFDGDRYLKRFFDLEYVLPEPAHEQFTKALFQTLVIPDAAVFITGLDPEHYAKDDQVITVFEFYAKAFDLGLRERQRVLRVIEAAIIAVNRREIHVHYLFFLAMLNYCSPSAFEELFNGRLTIDACAKAHMPVPVHVIGRSGINNFGDANAPSKTPLVNIIDRYFGFALRDLKDIVALRYEDHFPDTLFSAMRAEMPNSYQPNLMYPPSIRMYPKLVRHAGHFI